MAILGSDACEMAAASCNNVGVDQPLSNRGPYNSTTTDPSMDRWQHGL